MPRVPASWQPTGGGPKGHGDPLGGGNFQFDGDNENDVENAINAIPVKGVANVVAITNQAGTYTQPGGGSNGVGATLTYSATGVTDLDGHDLAVLETALLTAQAAPAQNGLYLVTTPGDVGVATILTRAPALDSSADFPGAQVNVGGDGTDHAGTIWMCTATGAPVLGTDALPFVQVPVPAAAVTVPPTIRPLRSTVAVIGDSISALTNSGWYQPWWGHDFTHQLSLLTHNRIRAVGNFALSGSTLEQQQSIQLPQVLAMDPLPGACILAGGTNSLGVSFDLATESARIKAMVAALLAVDVAPILWCPPPDNFAGAIHANMYAWCAWIRRYAAANGFALIDAFSALGVVDGTAIPGTIPAGAPFLSIHPNGSGHRLIVQKALQDGLADIFPRNSLVNTARTADDMSNMFNNGVSLNYGVITTQGATPGVGAGFTPTGSGTYAFGFIAPSPADDLMGVWQEMLVSSIGGSADLLASFASGWSIGDTIAFSARVQTSGVEASGGWWLLAMKMDTPSGYTYPAMGAGTTTGLWNGVFEWDADVPDGELYVEFVIPPEATDLQLWIAAGGLTAATNLVLKVGEVTIRNLTTEGLLV